MNTPSPDIPINWMNEKYFQAITCHPLRAFLLRMSAELVLYSPGL